MISHFGVNPVIDLFASDRFHVTPKFVTKFYTPGCEAVHALAIDWSLLVKRNECAWAFPPVGLASLALKRIQESSIEVLLCVPAPVGSIMLIALHEMQQKVSTSPFAIPKSENSCRASLRVPNGTLNPAFLGLQIFHIKS